MIARLLELINKHWGYSSLRPLQEEAMLAALSARDPAFAHDQGASRLED